MNDNEIATSQIAFGLIGLIGNTKGLLYTNECVDSSIVGCSAGSLLI